MFERAKGKQQKQVRQLQYGKPNVAIFNASNFICSTRHSIFNSFLKHTFMASRATLLNSFEEQ